MATTTLAASLNPPIIVQRSGAIDRVLVVEDDRDLQKELQHLFLAEGYEVEMVADSKAALQILRKKPPSALVLDLQYPGSSGCDLCQEITRLAPGVPLMILSANSDVVEKILLLEIGADDYVTIPFVPRELVARLRALVRRASRAGVVADFVFDDVMVDFSKMDVTRSGEKVQMTAKEFKTLEFMTKNAQRVVSRDELLNEVWGYQNYPCTRTVDNHILRLRQKLESDPSDPSHFLTIHGVGYKFVP